MCTSGHTCVTPGLYAMVGAAAALGGVTRMTGEESVHIHNYMLNKIMVHNFAEVKFITSRFILDCLVQLS